MRDGQFLVGALGLNWVKPSATIGFGPGPKGLGSSGQWSLHMGLRPRGNDPWSRAPWASAQEAISPFPITGSF